MSILRIANGVDVWGLFISNINVPLLIVLNIVPPIIMLLWLSPIIAWFMLVSSFSTRPPFLVAFAVPALIIATEELFFNGSLLVEAIISLFENWAENIVEGTYFATTSFADPAFWIGLVITAALISGTIYFRKRHALA